MIEEFRELAGRHKNNGILIDANLLLLLLVGRFSVQRIESFKRTSIFRREDFRLLEAIVRQFSRILSTAHVLTEVSNLATAFEPLAAFRETFRQTIDIIDERNCKAKEAAANPYFRSVGLTDAAILALADRQFLLLTVDAALALISQATGGDAINFNHLRPIAWEVLSPKTSRRG